MMMRTALVSVALLFASIVHAADRSVDPIVSHIRRAPVESKALAAAGYSKRLHALEIEFRDGLIYRYLDVPSSVHRAFELAESKARFYNREIRGKYHSLRVRRPRED